MCTIIILYLQVVCIFVNEPIGLKTVKTFALQWDDKLIQEMLKKDVYCIIYLFYSPDSDDSNQDYLDYYHQSNFYVF